MTTKKEDQVAYEPGSVDPEIAKANFQKAYTLATTQNDKQVLLAKIAGCLV
jgi:hypothetical protein